MCEGDGTIQLHNEKSDKAPIVYDAKGNPMKVRVIGGECEGDLSGEGHYAYREDVDGEIEDGATVWFEKVESDDAERKGES